VINAVFFIRPRCRGDWPVDYTWKGIPIRRAACRLTVFLGECLRFNDKKNPAHQDFFARDVIHALPAVTDLQRAAPGAHIDWVVEESLAPIARLHPGVE